MEVLELFEKAVVGLDARAAGAEECEGAAGREIEGLHYCSRFITKEGL